MATRAKDLKEKKLILDARGRINVRPLFKYEGVTSVKAEIQEDGTILLRPLIDIELHPEEAWLYKNKKALAMVEEGLADSAAGRVSGLADDFWDKVEALSEED